MSILSKGRAAECSAPFGSAPSGSDCPHKIAVFYMIHSSPAQRTPPRLPNTPAASASSVCSARCGCRCSARWLNQIMPERQKSAVEEHTQIISALLGKDLDQSICAIRQHLTNSEHAFETVYHSGHMRQISKMLSSAFAEQSPQA